MLRGRDVEEVVELKRQGLSIRAISRMTDYDRRTISRNLAEPSCRPVYKPRAPAPGKQAQVDWGHLGSLSEDGRESQRWGFTMTSGHSRKIFAAAATDQKLGTLLRMHEAAFYAWGAVRGPRRQVFVAGVGSRPRFSTTG